MSIHQLLAEIEIKNDQIGSYKAMRSLNIKHHKDLLRKASSEEFIELRAMMLNFAIRCRREVEECNFSIDCAVAQIAYYEKEIVDQFHKMAYHIEDLHRAINRNHQDDIERLLSKWHCCEASLDNAPCACDLEVINVIS